MQIQEEEYQPLVNNKLINPAQQTIRSVGILQLIGLAFFAVSGGPYGIEEIASTAPPFYVLLSFLVLPIIWCLPLSLMTAELSTRLPQDGGASMWVTEGLGSYIGWSNAMLTWIVFLVDSATYPKIIIGYIQNLWDMTLIEQYAISIGIVFLIMIVNLRTAKEVGWLSLLLCICSVAPFLIFMGMAVFKEKLQTWVWTDRNTSRTPMQLGLLMSYSIWNTAGWEDVGMLAGEVKNQMRTFPVVLFTAILLQTICNLLPVAVGLAMDPNTRNWQSGYFGVLAQRVGGTTLNSVMLVGAIVSNLGLLEADILNSSRLVFFLSSRDKKGIPWIPRFIGKLYTRHKIPRVAVVVNCIIVASLTFIQLDVLIQMDVFIMCFSYLLICVSFVIMRFNQPPKPRNYLRLPAKYPLVAFLYAVFPLFIVLVQLFLMDMKVLLIGGGMTVCAFATYGLIFHVFLKCFRKSEEEIQGGVVIPKEGEIKSLIENVS